MYLVEIGVCVLTYFKKCNQIRCQVRYLCDKYYDCSKLDNMSITETKNRTKVYYMNSTFYYGNITVKVKIFENPEYLSNKINAESNIRLWNPENWFLTKQI